MDANRHERKRILNRFYSCQFVSIRGSLFLHVPRQIARETRPGAQPYRSRARKRFPDVQRRISASLVAAFCAFAADVSLSTTPTFSTLTN